MNKHQWGVLFGRISDGGSVNIESCYNQGYLRGYRCIGGLIGASIVLENAPGMSYIYNSYNTGEYKADDNFAFAPFIAAGRNCNVYNTYSADYGGSPSWVEGTVQLLNGTTRTSNLKAYANVKTLGSQYRDAVRK